MRDHSNLRHRLILKTVSILILALMLVPPGYGQRTRVKPGFNLFSLQQDVELGQKVAEDAEKQLPMLNNSQVDAYLDRLGKKLASYAPGEKYPYQFKCVNDSSINAFALPGGFLFVNRGVIEAADNEAELAGVIGHEIGHVALRHGTNQASKSLLTQFPLAILSGFLDEDSIKSAIVQLGAGFVANSILLKYSRDAERQADLIGTQILFDANYNPRYMAEFFKKLDAGDRGADFFSSHPNPENRIDKINVEIGKLGYRSSGVRNNSEEFNRIKSLVASLPPPPESKPEQKQSSSGDGAVQSGETTKERHTGPDAPSSRFRGFYSDYIRLRYPENWHVFGHDKDFSLTPDGGILRNRNDSPIVYGVSISVSDLPESGSSEISLEEATDRLMQDIRRLNPSLRRQRNYERIRVDGKRALSAIYSNESPLGGNETDWIVTVMRPEGLTVFIFIVPERDYRNYRSTFEKILDSVDFRSR